MKKSGFVRLTVVVSAALLLAAYPGHLSLAAERSPPATPKLPPVISFATAAVGTSSYIVGGAFSSILKKFLSLKVAIEPSGGATRWVPLMARQEVDFGIHCSYPDLYDAYYGLFGYQKMGPQPIVGFVDGHIVPWGLISNNPNIKTVYDLKGKRLYGRIVGQSLYERGIPALLSAAGLTGQVEVLTFPNVEEAARGLVEGRADALVYLPIVAPLLEASRTKRFYPVVVPKEVVDKINKIDSAITFGIWKKGVAFATQDTPSMFFGCGMSARETLDAEIVYVIAKTIYSHYDEYKGVHSVLGEWNPENGARFHVTPFHPGAVRYFKEVGVWTPDREKRNQDLIAKRHR